MVCGRCGTVSEGPFCPHCGAAIATGPTGPQAPAPFPCPRCGTGFFGNFCPTCGTPRYFSPVLMVMSERGAWRKELFAVGWILVLFIFFALVAMNMVTLAYASGLIVPGILAQDPTGCRVGTTVFECRASLYLVSPFPLATSDGPSVLFPGLHLYGVAFLAWFMLVLGAIVAAHLFLLWRDGRLTLRELRQATRETRAPFWSRSAWITVAQVFALIICFDEGYFALLRAAGVEVKAPDTSGIPVWYQLYSLAFAPVYEESWLRLVYLGLLLGLLTLLVASATRSAPGLKLTDFLLGGKFTLNRYSVGPWIFSAALFASAHVLGGSWAPWKVGDTFVAGLILGYLFLRRGLPAAILLHFTIDYLGAGELAAGQNLGYELFVALAIIVISVVGFFIGLKYLFEAVRRIGRALGVPGRRPGPTPLAIGGGSGAVTYANPSPAPAWGPGGFACPRCGGQEARYADGRLQCSRCGLVT